jgi:N,N-dimethylformamidase
MYKINPNDTHLAKEFKAKPIGHHSADLQKVLNLFRGEAMADKYCLICTRPHEEWVLAQFSGRRGIPPRVHHNRVFTSIEEAEWEVFKLRWEKYTGHKLED